MNTTNVIHDATFSRADNAILANSMPFQGLSVMLMVIAHSCFVFHGLHCLHKKILQRVSPPLPSAMPIYDKIKKNDVVEEVKGIICRKVKLLKEFGNFIEV